MKAPLSLLACFVALASVLRAEVEFAGFFSTPKETRFMLADSTTRAASGWLKLNETFQGFTIAAFDAKREVILLKQGDQAKELPLRAAKVKDGRSTITGVIDIGMGESINDVRASLSIGEESGFPVSDTVTFYLKPEILSDNNIVYRARFVRKVAEGRNETITAPAVRVLPGQPFSIQVGQMGYSFTPEKK